MALHIGMRIMSAQDVPITIVGPVYGHQWRSFNGVDQLSNLVYEIKIIRTHVD